MEKLGINLAKFANVQYWVINKMQMYLFYFCNANTENEKIVKIHFYFYFCIQILKFNPL